MTQSPEAIKEKTDQFNYVKINFCLEGEKTPTKSNDKVKKNVQLLSQAYLSSI